jgi:L-lactate dehydrogenase complex protein LldG
VERDVFLGRVTAALRSAALPVVATPGLAPSVSFDDPVARFADEAEAVDATVERVAAGGVLTAVTAVFKTYEASRFLAWEGLDEVVPGWDAWVHGAGYQRVDATVRPGPRDRKDDHARVGEVLVGITTAAVGIAASGSVVLAHGAGRPRSASLLVENHLVLLPVGRIVESLADAMKQVTWDGTSNIAVITGPSRTGDIDAVLTLGVHGPRHLHIIVIE